MKQFISKHLVKYELLPGYILEEFINTNQWMADVRTADSESLVRLKEMVFEAYELVDALVDGALESASQSDEIEQLYTRFLKSASQSDFRSRDETDPDFSLYEGILMSQALYALRESDGSLHKCAKDCKWITTYLIPTMEIVKVFYEVSYHHCPQ